MTEKNLSPQQQMYFNKKWHYSYTLEACSMVETKCIQGLYIQVKKLLKHIDLGDHIRVCVLKCILTLSISFSLMKEWMVFLVDKERVLKVVSLKKLVVNNKYSWILENPTFNRDWM